MITWVIFVLDLYAFYFVDIVSLAHNVALATVLSITYFGILIIVVYYAIKSTKNDPTDKTIYAEREAKANGYKLINLFFRLYFDNKPFKFFCEVCDAHVKDNSKHCG